MKHTANEIGRAIQQGYDPHPPICHECVYFKRTFEKKRGHANKAIDRCTFGNFPVSWRAVCDEWRTKHGEHL